MCPLTVSDVREICVVKSSFQRKFISHRGISKSTQLFQVFLMRQIRPDNSLALPQMRALRFQLRFIIIHDHERIAAKKC